MLIPEETTVIAVLRENRVIGGGKGYRLQFEVFAGEYRGRTVLGYLWVTPNGRDWTRKILSEAELEHPRDLLPGPAQVYVEGKVKIKHDRLTGEPFNEFRWPSFVPGQVVNRRLAPIPPHRPRARADAHPPSPAPIRVSKTRERATRSEPGSTRRRQVSHRARNDQDRSEFRENHPI